MVFFKLPLIFLPLPVLPAMDKSMPDMLPDVVTLPILLSICLEGVKFSKYTFLSVSQEFLFRILNRKVKIKERLLRILKLKE